MNPSRFEEIQTFYADAMFTRILERGSPSTLDRQRSAHEKIVGCCRDAAVIFLSMARRKNIPARSRVGFVAYLCAGLMIDHVVVEVWDGQEQRWRLFDPEMPMGLVKTVDSQVVDWLDLRPGIDFQTGAEAWIALRNERIKPDQYVVAPELHVPELRGAPYIAHNLVIDLAHMNKQEMLLWDSWGILVDFEGPIVPEEDMSFLDDISRLLSDQQVDPAEISELMVNERLHIPDVVIRAVPSKPGANPT